MLEQLFTGIHHGEGTFEAGREFCDVIVEFGAARNGLFQADDHEAVALFGLFSDRFALYCCLHDGRDVERGVGFFLGLLRALYALREFLHGLAGLFSLLFGGLDRTLAGFLVILDVHDGRRHCP